MMEGLTSFGREMGLSPALPTPRSVAVV